MESRKIVDAAHLRVIAHPTRLRLLGLLREFGPLTAKGLSAYVDEAPGTLSYHLTKLAEAGFVEEEQRPDGDRRQRWWRALHGYTVWDDADLFQDPEKLAASKDFSRIVGQIYAQQYLAYMDTMPSLEREWVEAATNGDRRLRLTASELAALRDDVEALEQKWTSVSEAHTAGDGSEAVFMLVQAYRRPQ